MISNLIGKAAEGPQREGRPIIFIGSPGLSSPALLRFPSTFQIALVQGAFKPLSKYLLT